MSKFVTRFLKDESGALLSLDHAQRQFKDRSRANKANGLDG